MTLTIQENPGHPIARWQLKTGDRKYYPAQTHAAVIAGVAHYMGEAHAEDICPFCLREKTGKIALPERKK